MRHLFCLFFGGEVALAVLRGSLSLVEEGFAVGKARVLEEAFYFGLFILEAVLVRPCVGLAVQVPVFLRCE